MSKTPSSKARSESDDSGSLNKKSSRRKSSTSSESFFDDDLGDDVIDKVRRRKSKSSRKRKVLGEDDLEVVEDDDVLDEEDVDAVDSGSSKSGSKPRERNIAASLRRLRQKRAQRPGDREVVRSKFILMLFGCMLVLGLVATIVWFLIGRNAAQIDFEQAEASYKEAKYRPAIDEFDQFIETYPRSEYTDRAHFLRGRCDILVEIKSASPDWEKALNKIDEFIKNNRDRTGYVDEKPELLRFAKSIAIGALITASTTYERDLLKIAKSAEQFAGQLGAESSFAGEFAKANRESETSIRKHETFVGALAEMQKDLDEKKPVDAIRKRNDLLQHFSNYEGKKQKQLDKILSDALAMEKSVAKFEEIDKPASTEDRPSKKAPLLSLTLHRRPQDDTKPSVSRAVIALGDNCCYGIDPIIGVPLWRRSIGDDTPFFPVKLTASEPAILLFDTHFKELILLKSFTGELIWRQTLSTEKGQPESVTGTPLVHEGQIFVTTNGRSLYRINMDNGQLTGKWVCSQNLVGPPLLVDSKTKLVIPGDLAFVYTLSLAKMECERVDYTGHLAGSIRVPFAAIGRLALMIENDKNNSARLRVFNTSEGGDWMEELTAEAEEVNVRVAGQVRQKPIIRSKTLYVNYGRERIKAFSISDDRRKLQTDQLKQSFIVKQAQHEKQSNYSGPTFIVALPNGEFLMHASKLFKFQLNSTSIRMEPLETSPGIAFHPPQLLNKHLYLGRKLPSSTAVTFTQTDLDSMEGKWRIVLGSPIEEILVSNDGKLVCVNDAGDIFRIREEDFAKRRFLINRNARVTVDPKTVNPLRIFPVDDNRIGVFVDGEKPQLSVVSAQGLVESRYELKRSLEADPVKLGDGLVLPMKGLLRYRRIDNRLMRIGDFEPTHDQEKGEVRWSQLVSFDSDQTIAVDSLGTIFRIELRQSGGQNSHLAGIRQRKLDHPVPFKMAISKDKLFAADTEGNVLFLDAISLIEKSRVTLPVPVSNDLWIENDLLFIESGRHELSCFRFENDLTELWKLPLNDDSGLAAKPLAVGPVVVVAKRNGEILVVDSQSGEVRSQLDLEEPIGGSPLKFGNRWVVPLIDGSLRTIDLEKHLNK